jgi:hypothetical protein
MSFVRGSCALFIALFVCGVVSTSAAPAGVASDGTVTGALTVNGKKFPLTHVYGRKREAWPADAKALGVDSVDDLSCGIVELIFTNEALPEAQLASILQNDYKGSEKIRGVRFVIDGSGKGKWETMFLLESGAVRGYGMTQTSGSIEGGRRFTGNVSCKNEEVTQVRMFDVTFDTGFRVQYSRTETEGAERIPEGRFADEFLTALPGEWKIERWLGLGCTTATGTLVVGERASPRAFQGKFLITTSKGDEIEEEVTISISGSKVHVEGGRVSVPESIWVRDVFDLELWEGLMVGNTATDFMVLRKTPVN